MGLGSRCQLILPLVAPYCTVWPPTTAATEGLRQLQQTTEATCGGQSQPHLSVFRLTGKTLVRVLLPKL